MSDQQSILVAVDPPTSLPDLTPVLALALGARWKIDLVHAVSTILPAAAAPISPEIQSVTEEAGKALAAQAASLATDAVDVEVHVLVGPAVDVVLTAAQMLNSALIVVVGHKHDVGDRTVLGSFTSALLKVADRPVLVLPAGPTGSQPGFVAAVDRLIELIDREDNSAEQVELVNLRAAATAQLQQPTSEQRSKHLGSRLLDVVHRLETSYPTLTAAINDVSYHLSGMGI